MGCGALRRWRSASLGLVAVGATVLVAVVAVSVALTLYVVLTPETAERTQLPAVVGPAGETQFVFEPVGQPFLSFQIQSVSGEVLLVDDDTFRRRDNNFAVWLGPDSVWAWSGDIGGLYFQRSVDGSWSEVDDLEQLSIDCLPEAAASVLSEADVLKYFDLGICLP